MKKLIIIGFLILALVCVGLLSGCGGNYIRDNFFSLDWWSPPGDGEFTSFVDSMDTPQKIADWMADNCDYTVHSQVSSPYEFWTRRWGDCSEYAVLSSWCGHENGYTTYLVYIKYTIEKAHRICIYDMGSTYSYTSTGHYYSGFSSFAKCVEDWDRHTSKMVDFYTVHAWNGDVVKSYNVTSSSKFITDPEPSGGYLSLMGSEPINRSKARGGCSMTLVNKDNPSQYDGTIKTVGIYANQSLTNVKIATFYRVYTNTLATRDYQIIGTVYSGSAREYLVDIDVQKGDWIGMSFTSGTIDTDTSGFDGIWALSGDNIPCTGERFTWCDGDTISLGGLVISP